MKKKILITGANGLLGRNLVELLSKKYKVYALVQDKKKIKFKIKKNISILEIDLANINLKKLPSDIDIIYYLAQSNQFKNFPRGTSDMISVNIITPNILAKWGIQKGVKKFIYTSTGGVYSGQIKSIKENKNINANKQIGFYNNTKLSAEMLLRNYTNNFETLTIIRPFFIYGFGQKKNMLIPKLILNIKNNKEITIHGNQGIKINPIYVTDAANAMFKILNLKKSMIINLCGKEVISLKTLILLIGKYLKKKPIIKYNHLFQSNLIGNSILMRKKLINPKIDLKKGIKMTIG